MANTTTNKTHDAVSSTAQQAKDAVSSAAEKVKDAANTGAEKAKDVARAGWDRTKDAAQAAGHVAENATSSVGGGLESLAGTIREKAPQEGMLGNAASTVADTLEKGGRYLREEGLGGMADDLTNTIRRNPLPSVLVGVAIGFLLARATRS
jgi:ElaB/YqjD/DUF883 family membrane-anchored ribosome-binding protein